MEETGQIKVTIEGTVNERKLIPDDVDISDIREILNDVETFLYPTKSEKTNRPHIAYRLEEGSARHIFSLPISAVILFNGLISEINNRKTVDFLDYKRAEIIEKFQRKAKEKGYEISLSSSISNNAELVINKQTNYFNVTPYWIKTEIYLYGEIYEEGGMIPNLHILTKEYGKLTVSATREQLLEGEQKLYKVYGIKASGKQNISDGKPFDLKLINYIDYNPLFNKTELDILISKATPNLSKIKDVDSWMSEIRGGVYE